MSSGDEYTQAESISESSVDELNIVWDFVPMVEEDFPALKELVTQALCFDVGFEPYLAELTDDIIAVGSADPSVGFKCVVADDEGAGAVAGAAGGANGFSTAVSFKKCKRPTGWVSHLAAALSAGARQAPSEAAALKEAFGGSLALLLTNRILNIPGSLVPHFYNVLLNDIVATEQNYSHLLVPVFKIDMPSDLEDEEDEEGAAGAARRPTPTAELPAVRAPGSTPAQEAARAAAGIWALPEFDVLVDVATAVIPLRIAQHAEKMTTRVPTAAFALVIPTGRLPMAIAEMMMNTDQNAGRIIDLE